MEIALWEVGLPRSRFSSLTTRDIQLGQHFCLSFFLNQHVTDYATTTATRILRHFCRERERERERGGGGYINRYVLIHHFIVQELCESRGGRPGLSVLTSLLVSVDVKIY